MCSIVSAEESHAPYVDMLLDAQRRLPRLHFEIIESAKGGQISAESIAKVVGTELGSARVFFCGPEGLREALRSGLARYGVGARNFSYEEFEIRSGIGLRKLLALVFPALRDLANRRIDQERPRGV